MSANSNNSWMALLTSQGIAIAVPGQHPPRVFENQTEEASSEEQILEKCFQELKRMRPGNAAPTGLLSRLSVNSKAKLRVMIETSWVRMFVCRWEPSLRTVEDFQRFCAIEFERRFLRVSSDWILQPDRMLPGKESLICAYQATTLARAQTLATDNDFALESILPVYLCELQSAMSQSKAGQAMYIDSAVRANILAWIETGRVRDILVAQANPSDDTQTLTQFAQLFCTRVGSRIPTELTVIAPTTVRSVIHDLLLANADIAVRSRVLKLEPVQLDDYKAAA